MPSVIIFLLILSFLVIIHELGHFVTALWMKVKIEEFGLGYPPRAGTLFKWRGIPFTFNWLPFGGFVRMEGEDGGENGSQVKLKTRHQVGPFYTKSKKARLLVLLAGVVVNFVFGVLAFSVVYTTQGIPTYVTEPIVTEVKPGSPAEAAGLQAEDVILAGRLDAPGLTADELTSSDEVIKFVNDNLGKNLVLTYRREDQQFETKIFARPVDQRPADEGAIGVAFQVMFFKYYPWWQMPFRGAWVGIQQSVGLSIMILIAFYQMFAQIFTFGGIPEGVAGPVGIVHQASKTGLFQEGWQSILNFMGMLSINLAILNVLPIPALDGGRALFVILETFIGRKRRETIEGQLNYFGFGFLLLFISVITFKDIWVLIKDVIAK